MASPDRRRPENVAGDFFVDDTCIDCDTCRWMAPRTFDRAGEMSRVHAQPSAPADVARALQALVACPTASIGVQGRYDVKAAAASFPEPVRLAGAGGVHHCGYHLENTFGAASYLVVRPLDDGGNVLVDSPRFSMPLVRRIEALGGVRWMFLTHKDDVGDHARFAEHFGCERVLHARDAGGALKKVEHLVRGDEPVELAPDLRVVPTPGHTAGSACLIVGAEHLFSGDHVAWSATRGHVYAFRSACWYDWDVQIESMRRLASERFALILPGHGRMCAFEPDDMRRRIAACAEWMETVR
jgi:glyoxylase-like metal-dependent hydrolase (beta-lactamase superfamily II)/ferredoxin